MNQNTSTEPSTDGEFPIFLTRVMDAPRELVWKAYSEAEALAQWWGPKGFSTRVERFDFRAGGVFHYAMQTPDGGEMWGKFVYREIEPPKRLSFVLSFADAQGNTVRAPFSETHPLEIYSEVTFTEHNGKTTITMRGGPWNATDAEREGYAAMLKNMQEGTESTLDNLADYLAKAREGATKMFAEPQLQDRPEQHYMGIRTQVEMREFGAVIPQRLGEILSWLKKKRIAPTSVPFLRFHIINMEEKLDVELGVPVTSPLAAEGGIAPGILPAGRYGTLVYTGIENGIRANKALLDWAAERSIAWDTYRSDLGDGFGARYESFLTDPDDEPNRSKWETEVAIRLADEELGQCHKNPTAR